MRVENREGNSYSLPFWFSCSAGMEPRLLAHVGLHPATPQTPREDGGAGHLKEESDLELVPGGTNS